MDGEQTGPDASGIAPGVHQVSVRRAPRLGVFLIAGALFGALVTLILTSLYPADPQVGFAATYAYFLVYGIPFGVLIGALLGLILDRRSERRRRTVTVEREHID
ncbi:hypothetical protein [Homoserinibacter sp. GY 40078]|uniref:hypothetical protein n=1 Tax=Homoserinibacter sp. GY 40078 TaxID=2603275 RepID=UPI0011CBC04E|nr:hypothetical protein [Homoserinibacter sp. GY 40078]TXK18725.1 hypothetical protein FVQ89_01930 [Homoserinibacter sp. GY 40078]